MNSIGNITAMLNIDLTIGEEYRTGGVHALRATAITPRKQKYLNSSHKAMMKCANMNYIHFLYHTLIPMTD